MISSIPVGDFRMLAKRICIIYMYVLSNSSKPVGDLAKYWLVILPIPVGDFANTGWRFRQYRRWYIFKDLGRFEVEIEDSKNIGGLEICLNIGSSVKK